MSGRLSGLPSIITRVRAAAFSPNPRRWMVPRALSPLVLVTRTPPWVSNNSPSDRAPDEMISFSSITAALPEKCSGSTEPRLAVTTSGGSSRSGSPRSGITPAPRAASATGSGTRRCMVRKAVVG